MHTYTQEEIDFLIKVEKIIKEPPKKDFQSERGSLRNNMKLASTDGNYLFNGFIRMNEMFPENFSVGLDYIPPDGSGNVCILRCNGPHGGHINNIDDPGPHFGHHIHIGKAEYINSGLKSEKFAEITKEYSTCQDAIIYFLRFCNVSNAGKYFSFYNKEQMVLFK